MILLSSTADLLRVTTSSAATVKVHTSHVDRSGTTITPGRRNTAIASTTTTTVVTSPAASTDRTVKFVSIFNDDASLSCTVTILHTDGTTAVDMWSATLAPQQGLQYDEGAGWSAPASIYATAAQGAKADTAVQPGANANTLGSGSATDNFVLTANGSGGVAWEAAAGGGGTPGGSDTQVQFNDGGAFGGDSGFTFDKTNNTLGITGATITASDPIIDMAQTWNASGTTFTAIKSNVTNTASASGSLLMDLQVGGSSRFSVGRTGNIFSGGGGFMGIADSVATDIVQGRWGPSFPVLRARIDGGVPTIDIASHGSFRWSNDVLSVSTIDLILARDAANTLAQRNGTTAQTFNLYNTYTDASNYERGRFSWVGNELRVGTEKAGTGATRSLGLYEGNIRYQVIGSGFTQFDQPIYMNTTGIVTGTSTGFKIGTGATQKLGFWNATPVAQPTAVADATDAPSVITQLNALLAHMRTIGLIAT
jgi:hypothetical protein